MRRISALSSGSGRDTSPAGIAKGEGGNRREHTIQMKQAHTRMHWECMIIFISQKKGMI